MADYYSLLARAVANLPKSSPPSTRRAIYDRARKALTTQLRSLKPQLPESDIAREERALDEAVSRLEAEFEPATADVFPMPAGGEADPGPAAAPAGEPAPLQPTPSPPPFIRPMEPAVSRMASQVRPAAPPLKPRAPTLPPAPGPAAAPRARPQVGASGLPKARELSAAPPEAPVQAEAPVEPMFAANRRDETAESGPAPSLGAAGGRDDRKAARPTLADAGARRAPGWLWVVAAIGVGFAASIAVVAYLMRPALQDLTAPAAVETPVAGAVDTQGKSPRRVGQTDEGAPAVEATPTDSPTPAADAAAPSPPATSASPPAPPAPTVASPAPTLVPQAPAPASAAAVPAGTAAQALPVSSRAAMLIATVADAAKPAISVGSVVWSLVPAPAGQPAGLGVKAEVDVPDLKMHASMILRKNLDGSLPASHTIDLRVTFDPGSPIKGIKDIALPLMRRDDPPAADALTGVRVKISDNYFLVGLNRGDADVARNVQELAERSWFDFPMQLDDDRIAKLTFEKGGDGEKLVAQALAAWK